MSKDSLFDGMGLKNLEAKSGGSGLTCELCHKPLEAEEYQKGNVIRLGPVCRKKALYNNFGQNYSDLDDKASHEKADTLINGKKEQVLQEFFKGDYDSYEEYLIKVNSLRKAMDINSEPIIIEPEEFLKAELKQIKSESIQFKPAFDILKGLGLSLDDIKYMNDPNELIYPLLQKGVNFNGTEEDLEKIFFEAQDYLLRHDRMALIKLELSPQEKLIKMAKKREADYQKLFNAGFTDEEILNHRSTVKNLKTDPVLRGKSIKWLQDNGIIQDPPKNEVEAIDVVAKNMRRVQFALKTGFWVSCCVLQLGCWVAQGFSGKKRPTLHIKACRKHPFKLFKEYKSKQKKAEREKRKAHKQKLKEYEAEAKKIGIEEEKKESLEANREVVVSQWEYVKSRKPSDIDPVSREAFFKASKKKIA